MVSSKTSLPQYEGLAPATCFLHDQKNPLSELLNQEDRLNSPNEIGKYSLLPRIPQPAQIATLFYRELVTVGTSSSLKSCTCVLRVETDNIKLV